MVSEEISLLTLISSKSFGFSTLEDLVKKIGPIEGLPSLFPAITLKMKNRTTPQGDIIKSPKEPEINNK